MFVDMHLDESIRKKRNIAIGVDSISLESLLWSNFILVRYIFKTYVRMLKNIRTLYSMCTSLWAIYFAHSSYKIVHFISYDWRHQIFFISFQSIDTPRISSFFSLSLIFDIIVSILFFNIENLNGMDMNFVIILYCFLK